MKKFLPLILIFLAQAVFPQTEQAVPIWRGALGGAVLCPPVCRDGAVIAVCEGGFVRAYSYNGVDLWTYRLSGKFAPFIVRGPDGVTWVAREESGVLRETRSLIALNRAGRKIIEIKLSEPLTAPPETGLDGRVFVPLKSGAAVYSLNGQRLGAASPLIPPEKKAEFPNVKLSLSRAEGRFSDGSLEWFLDIEGAAALPAYAEEGLLVVGGKNWIIAAYDVKAKDGLPREFTLKETPQPVYGLAKDTPIPEWLTLEDIEIALDKGKVDDNERVFASFLRKTGRYTPQKRLSPEDIANKEKALRLLGRLGSAEYVQFLIEAFNRETNPHVRAAAARAIGEIGIDRGGKAMQALIAYALPVLPLRNEVLLEAVIDAAAKLCAVNGPPLFDSGLAVLNAYRAQKTYPKLQEQAAALLASIM